MGQITYPVTTVVDDGGSIVTGATVTIASVKLKDGTAVASHGATVNLDPAGADVSVDYDAEAKGDAWIVLAVSKTGSTFTGTNASPRIFATRDPQRINIDYDATVLRTATAQAGGASTITLDSGASGTDGSYVGHTIRILSGTGAGGARQVVAYNGTTKVATVNRAWTTNPDATSVFAIRTQLGPVVDGNTNAVLQALPTDWVTATAVSAGAVSKIAAGVATPSVPTAVQIRQEIDANSAMLAAIAGYIDTEVAAIKAKTDQLVFSSTGVFASTLLANAPTGSGGATATAIADAVLGRNLAGGSDGGRTVRDALRFLRNRWYIAGSTLNVTAEDDATVAWTSTLTTSGTANPVTGSDPA